MWRTGSRRVSFSSCGWRAQEHGLLVVVGELRLVVVQGFSCPQGMWDPPTFKDQTHIPCIGRQILNH